MKVTMVILSVFFIMLSWESFPKTKDLILPKESRYKLQAQTDLDLLYRRSTSQKELLSLKQKTLSMSGKAVPVLIQVMKSSEYSDKSRWMATFLLGKVMGKKAAPFIAKFVHHPNWILRMASLKTLTALNAREQKEVIAQGLKDKSLFVRSQALEAVRKLSLQDLGPQVWAMMYDEQNYDRSNNRFKRANIIKKVITTIGDLKIVKAKDGLFKMVGDKKYGDVFSELDYSLAQITGKKSPDGDQEKKRVFWSRLGLKNKVIN